MRNVRMRNGESTVAASTFRIPHSIIPHFSTYYALRLR
jgi:hypothetical protein